MITKNWPKLGTLQKLIQAKNDLTIMIQISYEKSLSESRTMPRNKLPGYGNECCENMVTFTIQLIIFHVLSLLTKQYNGFPGLQAIIMSRLGFTASLLRVKPRILEKYWSRLIMHKE